MYVLYYTILCCDTLFMRCQQLSPAPLTGFLDMRGFLSSLFWSCGWNLLEICLWWCTLFLIRTSKFRSRLGCPKILFFSNSHPFATPNAFLKCFPKWLNMSFGMFSYLIKFFIVLVRFQSLDLSQDSYKIILMKRKVYAFYDRWKKSLLSI